MDVLRDKTSTTVIILLITLIGVLGCAGGSPDFRARTPQVSVKQNQLVQWLDTDSTPEASEQITAPVCSASVGHPVDGWAIDDGSWCVVDCPVDPPNGVFDRWLQTHDGLRCWATQKKPSQLVTLDLEPGLWNLDSQLLFKGFDRSFVSNTYWECEEQEYQVDPDNNQGFWATLDQPGNTYSFYDDGALMVGKVGSPMKFAGDWRANENATGFSSGVVINDREMFRFAVNYGGGRFDEYSSATRKQECRFKDHPGPRL